VVERAILSVTSVETVGLPVGTSRYNATKFMKSAERYLGNSWLLPTCRFRRRLTPRNGMQASTLGLAIIPPVLALAVERLNPINERLLRRSAVQDLQPYEAANHQHLIDDATKMANGAVEVAGLAPTLVASVTSGFGILHELPHPFWPAIIYVLIFICLVLLILRLLVGQTFLQLDDRPLSIHLCGKERTLSWTGTQTVSKLIYVSNFILIAFGLLTYCIIEQPWNFLWSGSTPSPGHP
jgi:hypothetical protein